MQNIVLEGHMKTRLNRQEKLLVLYGRKIIAK